MPKTKQKTSRSAAKRIKKTGSGHFKHRKAFKSHLLSHKKPGRKRGLRGTELIHHADEAAVRRLLPNG